jgi:hypothetical protein
MMGVNAIGERAILNAVVTTEAAANLDRIPPPLFVVGSALGGAAFGSYTAGPVGGVGLNNVGLLVKVCGTVKAVNDWDIQISDGSITFSVLAVGFEIPALSEGDFISVVGVSSLELDPDLKPIVKASDEGSIVKLN